MLLMNAFKFFKFFSLRYTASVRVLAGGEILDAFGFPVGDGSLVLSGEAKPLHSGAKNVPDCVEQSEAKQRPTEKASTNVSYSYFSCHI